MTRKVQSIKKSIPNQKTGKHPGGRPTLYREEYCQKLLDYFNVPEVRIERREVYDKKTQELREMDVVVATDLPTLAGFCCKLGIARDTLTEWGNVHPEFSAAVKKAKQHQERILVTNGMNGLYNTPFAIFTAKNLIHWSDRQEITGKDGKDLVPDQNDKFDVARRIAFILSSAIEKEEGNAEVTAATRR